ncbi:MAG: hypothetical protein A3I66_14360 [Burkholderiales bacterium RIFCSPLOWO2_02_FULL_57_36]|nr:MAG: hypothetical protein A3I66_14360 [Burkholderiales bacterium RIFCSPLOWO2_02_FULL_57_36]
MKFLLNVARVYVIFFGASGFLFGQLFFGQFSWAAMLAGVSGVAAGLLGQRITAAARFLTIAVCATGIAGVAMDAFHYYSELHSPGNYYAWFFIGPFAAALIFIGYLNARLAHTSAVA